MTDDHSRLAYSEIHHDEKGPTCAGFLTRAAAYFAAHGITRIERVMTDNHFSYRLSNDVQTVFEALGAKHVLIRRHCPWQNGKVERLNRNLQTEWAYRQIFTSNTARADALAPSSSTTTPGAATPASTAHPSAACHPPDCQIQLGA